MLTVYIGLIMKLQLKMYNVTLSHEQERDDITSDDLLSAFIGLMLAVQYHPESIRKSIIELAREYEEENLCNK